MKNLETIISGRVVDLSDIEDFVTKTSPHMLRTMVDREVNKVQSQAAQYVFSMKGKRKPFPIGLILLMVVGVVLGIILLLFLPQILQYFQGFGGV